MSRNHLRALYTLIAVTSVTFSTATVADQDSDGYEYQVGCVQPLSCDCNDADPGVNTGAAELCDGYDNDCDGQVDNSPTCPLTCDSPRVINPRTTIPYPYEAQDNRVAIVWSGTEFGMVWEKFLKEGPIHWWEVVFTRVDRAGRQLGDVVRVSFLHDSGSAFMPKLVWTGDGYGVVWSRYRAEAVFFTRLDRYGNKLGADLQVTDTGGYSGDVSIAWNGREYGIAWTDDRDSPGINREIYFVRISADGAKIGSDTRVTNSAENPYFPKIVWNGSLWAIAWKDNRFPDAIYFLTLNPDGSSTGLDWPITDMEDVFDKFDLVWIGSGYGLFFSQNITDPGTDPMYLQLLDELGQPSGDPQPIYDPDEGIEPSSVGMAWTGAEYGMVWSDPRTGQLEVRYARADASAAQIGGELQVSRGPERSYVPAVAWSGHLFGVAYEEWISDENRNSPIHLDRVRCRCDDSDSDGTCADIDCNDSDDGVQLRPNEVPSLVFTDQTTLQWDQPADPGAPVVDLLYDTIRSTDPSDFTAGAVCIEWDNGPDTTATDPEQPPAGTVFYYLIRPENDCPDGQGMMGAGGGGVERIGRGC